jgi:YegS/Rv2252/BmrU family lipid kinase
MSSSITAIINPASSAGRTGDHLTEIGEKIKYFLGDDSRILITSKPDHATHLSRNALLNECDLIVAIGGDGTINEVINGFFYDDIIINKQAKLGIINFGTGSGLAQSLHLPNDLSKQFEIIKIGESKKIDCGRIVYHSQKNANTIRYFINEFQLGIGGAVVKNVKSHQKRLGGSLAFGLTTIKSVFSHPNQSFTIEIDHHKTIEDNFTGVIIANGDYTGGGMNLAPGAKLDDGYFNVLLIHGLTVPQRLIAFSKVYSGKHINNGKFSYFPAKYLNINSCEKVVLEADGELLGHLPCSVEILSSVIPICSLN